jgi:rSAM/selenodomain-associated transferase 2
MRDQPGTATADAPPGLSIIIPVLNAAALLPQTLAAVGNGPDVIVVDGGSSDRSTEVASTFGARVMTARRGRGSQLAAGVTAAVQPWLLLLHADTTLRPGWRTVVAAHMAQGSTRAAYFRFTLNTPDPRARRLERMVAWRCRVLGLPYGDQGLLIHRDLLRAVGGMKPLPLMEDVDLIRRIGRNRLVGLPVDAVTSAKRWEQQGYLRRSARNLMCLSLWFAGIPPRLIVRLYA